MKIIADVMGGDRAPLEMIKGIVEARTETDAEIVMVGNEKLIKQLAKENSIDIQGFEIVNAEDVVTMEDDPISAVRKKPDASMIKGLRMLSEGEGDAFVSCGNTGALFTASYLVVRKIKGVGRPGIGSVLPLRTPTLLLDSGANVECKPEYLEQFAAMGSIYMEKIYGMKNARVGLLNNGAESSKGTPLYVETYKKLSNMENINFVGNVEASKLAKDPCDVLVADGFTGNILLKTFEGVGSIFFGEMKNIFYASVKSKLAALIVKKGVYSMKKKYDPEETGGSPILGIKKPVIKAHGSSKAKAFKNAILKAEEYANSKIIEQIEAELSK